MLPIIADFIFKFSISESTESNYLLVGVVMFTVNSDQKVPRWDQVVQIPLPFILILCCLTWMSNETSRGTTKKLKPKQKGKKNKNLSLRGRKVALFLKKYEITLFFSLKEAGRDSWKFILNLNAVLLTNYQYVILKVLNWTVQKN